jgi:tetratricopeptide (TPR) repeat protein
MKRKPELLWILAACMVAGPPANPMKAQNSNSQKQQPQNGAPQSQPNGNPFPDDEKSVPVMPAGNVPDIPENAAEADSSDAAPPNDSDPVRSPEQMAPGENGATEGFSSSHSGLDNLIPDPDKEPADAKGKKGDADVMPHESADKDVDVGNYYMANKNWRGALSRFQSAMVLAPENPDVYWGLAECYRHLGQFADARTNYEKVAQYDPDSKHGKDAQKALKDPEIAKAASTPAQK